VFSIPSRRVGDHPKAYDEALDLRFSIPSRRVGDIVQKLLDQAEVIFSIPSRRVGDLNSDQLFAWLHDIFHPLKAGRRQCEASGGGTDIDRFSIPSRRVGDIEHIGILACSSLFSIPSRRVGDCRHLRR